MSNKAIKMTVSGLMVDPLTSLPIVILKNDDGDHILPIWVGAFEAQAIAMKREHVEPPRPLSHDLMASLIHTLEATVEKVVINDLRENTYYATIHLATPARRYAIDSRPSDGIALALRVEAPIFVEPIVLEKSTATDQQASSLPPSGEGEEQDLRSWFEHVDPTDFTKYQM